MNRKEIITKIGHLQDKHPISSEVCPGCEICNEVEELGKLLKYSPKTQAILDKGEDITTSEIRYLLEREVDHADIANALAVNKDEFKILLNDFGIKRKRRRIADVLEKNYEEMAKSMKDYKIAEELGIDLPVLKRWKEEKYRMVKKEDYEKLKKLGATEPEAAKQLGFKSKYEMNKWKKQHFSREEAINLNKFAEYARIEKVKSKSESKDIRNEKESQEKDVNSHIDNKISHVKYNSTENEQKLKQEIAELKKEIAANGYLETAIENYKERLEFEKIAKKKMIKTHIAKIREIEAEKINVHRKYTEIYLELGETKHEFEKVTKLNKELESQRDQLLLKMEKFKRELKPSRELLAVYVNERVDSKKVTI